MEKLVSRSLQFFVVAAIAFFGAAYATSQAHAMMIKSEEELMRAVEDVNAGYDWVPACGDNAVWAPGAKECMGGNGSEDKNYNEHKQRSYDLKSKGELLAKIKDLNVGWNWVPRCGDGAHWNWDDQECKGGANN